MSQTNKQIAEDLRDLVRDSLDLSAEEFEATRVVVNRKGGRLNISVGFGAGLPVNEARSEALHQFLIGFRTS
jgi:hypothetical protein